MPNHVHVIIQITEGLDYPGPQQFGQPQAGSLGKIVGAIKAAASKRINPRRTDPTLPFWQSNFHEHVIRNEAELQKIREYIINNPGQWATDSLHPANERLLKPQFR